MNLSEKYLSLKQELENVEEEMKSSMGVEPGQLVLFKNKHYRVKYVFVDNKKGIPYLYLTEIKNHGVNWVSSNVPRIYHGDDFEVIDWEFDREKITQLVGRYYSTDSISEKEKLKQEIESMCLSCYHDWEKYGMFSDNYMCKQCGCTTITNTVDDWLNGKREEENIDIPI